MSSTNALALHPVKAGRKMPYHFIILASIVSADNVIYVFVRQMKQSNGVLLCIALLALHHSFCSQESTN